MTGADSFRGSRLCEKYRFVFPLVLKDPLICTAPTIPERVRRLPEYRHGPVVDVERAGRDVVRRLDYPLLAADRAQPGADAHAGVAGRHERGGGGERFLPSTRGARGA